MRNRDWSSDVCASDLISRRVRRSPRKVSPFGTETKAEISISSTLGSTNLTSVSILGVPLPASHALTAPGVKTRLRARDRKSVVEVTRVSVRVDLGGRRIINKPPTKPPHNNNIK